MVGELSVKGYCLHQDSGSDRLDYVLGFSVFNAGNRFLQGEFTDPSV